MTEAGTTNTSVYETLTKLNNLDKIVYMGNCMHYFSMFR